MASTCLVNIGIDLADAKIVTNFTIGGQLNCSAVLIKETGDANSYNYSIMSAMILTDKCIPLIAANLYKGENISDGTQSDIEVANIFLYYKSEPLLSESIVTPPKICSNADSLDASRIPRDKLILLHLVNINVV